MSKILVIDDEEIIRTLAQRILNKAGYEIALAENGKSGVEKFQAEKDQIEAVICDMVMDDMSGFEVLSEIRKENPTIPGVISSGNPYNPDDVPDDIKDNIHFLQKPYRAKQLSELVQSILVSS